MPYEVKIEDNGTRSSLRVYGILTTSELYALDKERFSDKEKVKKYKVIFEDFSEEIETQLDDLDTERLAKEFRNASKLNPDIIAVSILPTDFMYGLGRMVESYIFVSIVPPVAARFLRIWQGDVCLLNLENFF